MSQPRLSREVHPGVHCITLPLPGKRPGPVNVYLFAGETVTLLDTGTSRTVDLLDRALAELGMTFSSIDRILVTHGHLDHYGGARKIKQAALRKVELVAPEEDVLGVETGRDAPPGSVARFLAKMGVPCVFMPFMRAVFFIFGRLADNCRVDAVVEDGQVLDLGDYEGEIIATPGHTRGSVCVFLRKEGLLFSGDHVLKHITPNALPMLEGRRGLPERKSQVEYYDSLARVEALKPSMVFPAHGEPIRNLSRIIAMYRNTFEARQQKVLAMTGQGDPTVFAMARRLFPDIRRDLRYPLEVYLSISEVYTHLQALEERGLVRLVMENNVIKVRRINA